MSQQMSSPRRAKKKKNAQQHKAEKNGNNKRPSVQYSVACTHVHVEWIRRNPGFIHTSKNGQPGLVVFPQIWPELVYL